MIIDFINKWDDIAMLGRDAGRFRVSPDHPLDLFIGFSATGEREFILEFSTVDVQLDKLPIFENIKIQFNIINNVSYLVLTLKNNEFQDLFSIICTDLSKASLDAENISKAILIFVSRLERWAKLLQLDSINILSYKERLGLLGELTMLLWIIDHCKVSASLAISGWRGPYGDTNDIGLNNVRIEIKSQLATQISSIKISSLEQLECENNNLFIGVYCFSPSNYGVTLFSLYSEISSRLKDNYHCYLEFKRKLLLLGFDLNAEYVNDYFKLEGEIIYQVRSDFPKLTFSNVAFGIEKANYELSREAIREFIVKPIQLEAAIND